MNQFIKILRIIGLVAFALYLMTHFFTNYTLLTSISGSIAMVCFGTVLMFSIYHFLNQHYIK